MAFQKTWVLQSGKDAGMSMLGILKEIKVLLH